MLAYKFIKDGWMNPVFGGSVLKPIKSTSLFNSKKEELITNPLVEKIEKSGDAKFIYVENIMLSNRQVMNIWLMCSPTDFDHLKHYVDLKAPIPVSNV
jgi:hypothetical protein